MKTRRQRELQQALAAPPQCPVCGATDRHTADCLRPAGTARRPEEAALDAWRRRLAGLGVSNALIEKYYTMSDQGRQR